MLQKGQFYHYRMGREQHFFCGRSVFALNLSIFGKSLVKYRSTASHRAVRLKSSFTSIRWLELLPTGSAGCKKTWLVKFFLTCFSFPVIFMGFSPHGHVKMNPTDLRAFHLACQINSDLHYEPGRAFILLLVKSQIVKSAIHLFIMT